MLIARNQTYVDHALDLNGARIEHCVFDDCILSLDPGTGVVIRHSKITNCDLVGLGWSEIPGALESC